MCFSHYFIFIPLTNKRNSKKIKSLNSFIKNLAALKYSMSTERQLDRTETFFSVNTSFFFIMFSEIIW